MAATLETWCDEEFRSVIRFLWAKHVSLIEIHSQLIEMYGDDEMKVQHVRKWYRLFQN
jgi:hypothetical protein